MLPDYEIGTEMILHFYFCPEMLVLSNLDLRRAKVLPYSSWLLNEYCLVTIKLHRN